MTCCLPSSLPLDKSTKLAVFSCKPPATTNLSQIVNKKTQLSCFLKVASVHFDLYQSINHNQVSWASILPVVQISSLSLDQSWIEDQDNPSTINSDNDQNDNSSQFGW